MNKPNESDTPETEAAAWNAYDSTNPEAESFLAVPADFARRLERERDEARADYEAALLERNKAWRRADEIEADNAQRTTRDQYREREIKSLTSKLAQRDEALKVAIEAIMAYEKAMQNGPENLSFRRYEELSEQGQAALRRIEELTKGGGHEYQAG